MKKDYCQRRFKDVVVWVVSSPGFTWARFARGSRPLSIYQTTTNTPSRSVTTALRCGWVQYIGRATILRREATTTTTTSSMRPGAVAGSGILVGQPSWNVKQPLQLPPPPPALCSLTLWLGAVYRSGSDPEVIIGNGFQEDAQQLVSRSEPADKIRVFPDFVGLLSDSPDLVFDQSFLCYFLQLHKTS